MTFFRDLGYALRSLSRAPALSAMLLGTIAIGIGAHTAIGGFLAGIPAEWFAVEERGRATAADPEIAVKMARVASALDWATALVFVTAAANVAGLLLSRAWKRSHETAARIALGASERHLASQIIADSLVISLSGGALGGLVAFWSARAFPALLFSQDAAQLHFLVAARPIAKTAAIYSAVMLVCALTPLLRIRQVGTLAVLRRSEGLQATAPGALRTGLVIVQMAVCCVLIVTAVFLLQGFRQALRTARGSHLGEPVITIFDAADRYARPERGQDYFRAVDAEAHQISALTTVAWISTPPGGRPLEQSVIFEPPPSGWKDVSIDTRPFPGGRDLARLRLERGRFFGGGDARSTCPVAIVNDAAQARYFGGDALGRVLKDEGGRRIDVVGIVAPAGTPVSDPDPVVYLFERQMAEPMPTVAHKRYQIRIVPPSSSRADVAFDVASANYFAVIGAPVVEGRLFPGSAASGSCDTAAINREAAEQYFAKHAVGGAVIDPTGRRAEITGVVDTGALRITQRRTEPRVYYAMEQRYAARMAMIAGTARADADLLAEVYRRLGAVVGGGPWRPTITLEEHLSRTSLGPERVAAALVGVSTAMALALALVGIYSAMADSVLQKKREIALRLALGAEARAIVGGVLHDGVRIAAAGALCGMGPAWLFVQVLARSAAGFGAAILWTWLAVPGILAAIVVLASILPARYALAVDPLTLTREG